MKQQKNQTTTTALLVEDEPIAQRVLSTQLIRLGYKITAANNAASAIQALNENHFSLILTDLRLPDKSGGEVIQATRLSDLNQDTVLIVCSSQLSRSNAQFYIDRGANAVLIKPLYLQVLEETIKECYQKRRSR